MNENSNAEKKPTETNWKLGCIREILIARHTPKDAVEKIIDRFGQEIDGFDNWRNACIFSEFVDTLRERYFMEDEKDACTCGTPWSGIHESMCPCFNVSEKPCEIVQAEPYPDTRSELQKESDRYFEDNRRLRVEVSNWNDRAESTLSKLEKEIQERSTVLRRLEEANARIEREVELRDKDNRYALETRDKRRYAEAAINRAVELLRQLPTEGFLQQALEILNPPVKIWAVDATYAPDRTQDTQEPQMTSGPSTPEWRAKVLDEFSETNPTYDMSIHSNPDAMAWAKFFVETVKDIGVKKANEGIVFDRYEGIAECVQDVDYMHGWFANAMMAMHDHLKRQGPPRIDRQCKEWRDMEEREISHYAQAAELARQICVHNFQPEAQGWEPLKDLPGVLTQISNMAAGMSAKIAKLEQEIETLRAQKPE